MDLEKLIKDCKREDRTAQKLLYDKYKNILFGITLRYIKEHSTAEDVFISAFYKILEKVNRYSGKGSFEGWMKRIVINESLMHLRKRKKFQLTIAIDNTKLPSKATIYDKLFYEDILQYLNILPTGYRTVFMLYEIEGYKHREIAVHLGISINTSKSQLLLAKKKLRSIIKKNLNCNDKAI